ncbi:hypothetical protein Rhopal_000730-T1 [Rhodotorula paludigena]|uniref:Uncharacterized protein n=1 Tax=Rhodotorula paludigena TaxID=86838 RepID=A0AAV5GDE8_9BASI|nr:hypothetical protein Rhopal_000730-T1 [Rhodotorula paludigena]
MGLDLTKGGLKPTGTPSTRPSHRSPPLSHERTTASPTFTAAAAPAPAPFPTPVSQPQQQYKGHKGAQHGLALPQKRPLGPRDVALDLDAGGSKKLRKKMRKVMDEADAVARARDSASEAERDDDDDDDEEEEMPPPKQPRKNGSVPVVAATATNGADKDKAIKGEGGDSAFTQQHDYIPLADTRHSSSPPAPAFDDLAPSQSDVPRPSQPGDVNTSAPSSDMDIVTVGGGEEHQTGEQSFIGSPLSIATDVETVSYFVEEREYLVLDDDDDADLAGFDAASAADSGAGSAWDSKTAVESLIDEEFDGEPMQASQEAEEGGATDWRDDGDLVAQAKAALSRVEKRFAEEQLEEFDNVVNKRRKLVPIDEEDDYLFTPQRSRSLAALDSSASLGPARTNGARSQYGDELAASQIGEGDARAQVVESHAGKPALPPTVGEWYEGAARPFMRWAERLAAEQQEKEEKREADEQHESGQALEGEVANEKDLGEYVKAFDSLKAKVEQLVDRKTTRHASHAAVLSSHGRTLQEKQALLDGSITNLINWSRPFFSSTKRLLSGGSLSKEEQGEQGNEQEEKEQVEED